MTDQCADIDYSAVKNLPELLDVLSRNGVSEDRFWDYVSAFQSIKAREAGIPLSGQFELTPLCNLDCKMCYVHLDQDQLKDASPLQPEQWKDIMAQAHSMGMMYATLTGGECLTYPGFEEVYLFLRSMGIRTSLITNGVLLDRKWMDFFSKHPPAGMTVSLYGSSGEAYQSVTGHDIFDAVYSHLLALKKAEFPVTVGITPSAYMLQDIPDLLKLVRQLDFSFVVNVALFQPRKETGREIRDLTPEEYAWIFRQMRDPGAVAAIPGEEHLLPRLTSPKDSSGCIRCGAGRCFFSVDWHGRLSACNNLTSRRVSLLETPFSDAWQQIHSEILSYPPAEECTKCEYDQKCFHCAAYRRSGAEAGHCNPKVCEKTRLYVKEGLL